MNICIFLIFTYILLLLWILSNCEKNIPELWADKFWTIHDFTVSTAHTVSEESTRSALKTVGKRCKLMKALPSEKVKIFFISLDIKHFTYIDLLICFGK